MDGGRVVAVRVGIVLGIVLGIFRFARERAMSFDERTRRLARLTVAIVLGRWDELRRVRAGAPAPEPDRAWREAVLQAHLFAGFPRLVEAYALLGECGGLGEPEPAELEAERPAAAHGRALFERIYAADAPRVRAQLAAGHADFARWIEEHAYARVLARAGLSADRRELLASCALAALGQERQLASHARGSLRCGASLAELEEALTAVGDLVGEERLERARRIVARIAAP